MTDQERHIARATPVHFAAPDRSYLGTPSQQRDKFNFLTYLLAGNTPENAAKEAGLLMHTVTRWRGRDQQFDADVERAMQNIRETMLYAIESNIFQQALEPSVAAANLGLRIMEKFDPAWSKDKDKQQERKAVADSSPINEWLDDPVIFEAEWSEIEEEDTDGE